MRNTFVKCLTGFAKQDRRVLLVTGDLGYGVLDKFWDVLPDQFFNAGIAEQSMTGLAAGLGMEGKIVFTYSIANFPTLRCLEQIRNDVAYNNANVKIVSIGGGMAYGPSGITHHATEDIAVMRAIPNMTVLTPGDPAETAACTRYAYEHDGPFYIRLGKGGEQTLHEKVPALEKPCLLELAKGRDVAILCCGAILSEGSKAVAVLKEKGISAGLYSVPFVKPIDRNGLAALTRQYRAIFTVEEHNLSGGFGSAVAEVIAQYGEPVFFRMIGLPDGFTSKVGSQQYLREYYGIAADDIVGRVLQYQRQRG